MQCSSKNGIIPKAKTKPEILSKTRFLKETCLCKHCFFQNQFPRPFNPKTMNEIVEPYLTLSSPAFTEGQHIPEKYTCEGENINPQLEIGNIPEGTQSLALIVDDPDAPNGTWTHWLMWDMPVLHTIMENEASGTQGKNNFGNNNYGGPCPPNGTHRYYFRVYALSQKLNLPEGASKDELLKAIEPVKLAKAELMGKYNR